jgi:ApaG protein
MLRGPCARDPPCYDWLMSPDDPSGPASEAVTQGIRVRVKSQYLPEHSSPRERRWAFSYTVEIKNEGSEAATLLARHWIITDASGNEEHVRGPGVVGYQPFLAGGQSFTYTSGAILRTPHGMMHGEYLMERPDGARFDASIAPFALATPESIH